MQESHTLAYITRWRMEDVGEHILLCPQQVSFYVIFSSKVFPSDVTESSADWLHPKLGTPACCSRCPHILA
jgi:hypothetical protein